MVTFRTQLWASGGSTVGIVVPPEVVEQLGRGARVPVTVTVDGGYTFRSTVASMGGRLLVGFSAATRAATGRGAGDEVEIALEVDDSPRTVEMPDALAAVAAGEGLAERWQRLSPSRQRAAAESVTSAKTDATRDRRVAAVLDLLRSTA